MKHGKKPTLKQKELIKELKLKAENWLVVKNLPGEMHIVNRKSNKIRIVLY